MDCHHARLLLAFWRRPADRLDEAEQSALRQHLDACPDCATLARDERRTDGALGPALRDVPIPDGLQQRLVHKLAAQRRPIPTWLAAAAVLAGVLSAGGSYLAFFARDTLTNAEVNQAFEAKMHHARSADDVANAFRDNMHVTMEAPRSLDYAYLRYFDLVTFRGRRIPMLVFYHPTRGEFVQVFVFSAAQFQIDELVDDDPASGFVVLREENNNPGYRFLAIPSSTQALDSIRIVAR